MNAVTNWQRRPFDLSDYVLPTPVTDAIAKQEPPPRTPVRRVVALASTWCVDGRPVKVGSEYEIAADAAESMVWRGKARFS